MAEIEITLPTVQYGNVKVRATPEELGVELSSPAAVGTATAIYLNLFTQGFKLGASMDVTASPTEGLSAPVGASQEAAPGNPQAAAERLADGRSPRTVDEANEMAKQIIENELGGVTEVPDGPLNQHPNDGPEESDDAPWNKPAVDASKKPWETDEATAPVVLDAAW